MPNIIMVPSDNFIDFPLPAHGKTWTAPDYGFVNVMRMSGAVNHYMGLSVISNPGMPRVNTNRDTGIYAALLLPVRKNDVVLFQYNMNGTIGVCRFIYAEGTTPQN